MKALGIETEDDIHFLASYFFKVVDGNDGDDDDASDENSPAEEDEEEKKEENEDEKEEEHGSENGEEKKSYRAKLESRFILRFDFYFHHYQINLLDSIHY